MFSYRPMAVGAALALLLCGPASARPIGDGGMLGGTRLGGPSPESYSPGLGQDLMKNGITFVLGSDGPGPSVPPEAEFEYELPVDDSGMLIARTEGGIETVGQLQADVVPEPTSMLMLGSGLLVAARRLRRR